MKPTATSILVLSWTELLIDVAGMPVSGVNLVLIGRTPLIHSNLKFVLLYQSACLLIRGACRFLICIGKIAPSLLSDKFLQPFRTVYSFSVYNRNYMIHILIVERIMATLMIATYERKSHRLLCLAMGAVVFCTSTLNMVTNDGSAFEIMITNTATLVVGALELGIFFWMLYYNQRTYKRMHETPNGHNLSKQYQLSENIRTGRQLTPTLLFNLTNIILTTMIHYYDFFFNGGDNQLVPVLLTVIATLLGVLIEITMITHHPFLKRDLYHMLKQIANSVRCLRGNQVSSSTQPTKSASSIAMRGIITGQVIVTGPLEQDQHFAMLSKSWENK